MAMVFICYRRDDSSGTTGRVHDRLAQEFGDSLIFMDVNNIPLGLDFVKVLRDAVSKCDVLLAVIGKHWSDARNVDDSRRLDSESDFVRIEIATALQRDIPVIPILVDGAAIPKAVELPEDLKDLSTRNGLDVRHGSFHVDMDRLINGLKAQMGGATTASVDWTAKLERMTRQTFTIELTSKSNEIHIIEMSATGELMLDGVEVSKPQLESHEHHVFKINKDRFDLHVRSGWGDSSSMV
jgi:hypothetical protein